MYSKLPQEIITYIYEFDPTYRLQMNKCLEYITPYWMFKVQGVSVIYYIYNPCTFTLHMTNSVKNPSYICSSFGIDQKQIQTLIQTHKMKRVYNIKLEFDIEIHTFNDIIF
jgi:hypothetical protein